MCSSSAPWLTWLGHRPLGKQLERSLSSWVHTSQAGLGVPLHPGDSAMALRVSLCRCCSQASPFPHPHPPQGPRPALQRLPYTTLRVSPKGTTPCHSPGGRPLPVGVPGLSCPPKELTVPRGMPSPRNLPVPQEAWQGPAAVVVRCY